MSSVLDRHVRMGHDEAGAILRRLYDQPTEFQPLLDFLKGVFGRIQRVGVA
jgi:hypothetical protein